MVASEGVSFAKKIGRSTKKPLIPPFFKQDAKMWTLIKPSVAHLVADYIEHGHPDWNFRSQSQAPGVSFSRGQETGPREAFNKLFESIANSAKLASITSGRGASYTPVRIKDAANYPNRWKRTLIPAYNHFEDGFDEGEVEDLGNDDSSNSEWS